MEEELTVEDWVSVWEATVVNEDSPPFTITSSVLVDLSAMFLATGTVLLDKNKIH